jgi:hypothetical protein
MEKKPRVLDCPPGRAGPISIKKSSPTLLGSPSEERVQDSLVQLNLLETQCLVLICLVPEGLRNLLLILPYMK